MQTKEQKQKPQCEHTHKDFRLKLPDGSWTPWVRKACGKKPQAGTQRCYNHRAR